jgi:hypothetical protein
MYKAVFSILIGATVTSSTAFAQSMYSKADCNKDADSWRTAYNKGDAESIGNWYDAKSGTFSGLSWTGTGHDAILAGFKNEMMSGIQLTSIVCEHSNQIGSRNVADGTWAGKDGKGMPLEGHWMSVSEIRDGKLVILTQLSNMDTLPPR